MDAVGHPELAEMSRNAQFYISQTFSLVRAAYTKQTAGGIYLQ